MAVIHKKKVPKSFYTKRDLPTPKAEYWPEDAGELEALVAEDSRYPRLLLGDGQHVRAAIVGERGFEAIRTEHCRRILSVDRESKLVRVEAGARWGDLQAELAERGLSLERYRLYPATATIGGLLASYEPTHRELWDGDLRTGCCALSSVSAGRGDYRYLAAPRKASGPDHRYLFIGGEGLLGAIVDVTLVAWEPAAARLVEWEVEGHAEAVAIVRGALDGGVRTSWIHYDPRKTTGHLLTMALHGPERLLDASLEFLRDLAEPAEVSDADAVRERRQKFEAAHPRRRALGAAARTLMAAFSLTDLGEALDVLEEAAERVEVHNVTRHRADVYARFAAGESRAELPGAVAGRALSVRPVSDDELVHWPYWAQKLKQTLDPERNLAAGP